MARLHDFSDTAIAAIMTRHSQPQRYGRSRQNQEAVRLIHEQREADQHEQNDMLTFALIEANPETLAVYRVAHTIRREREWYASNVDAAVNGWKRWKREQRAAGEAV